MKKNILILGGSSDIGIELIELLLKKNFLITCHCTTINEKLNKILKKSKNVKIVKKNLYTLNDKNINKFCKKNFDSKYGAFVNLVGYTDNRSFANADIKNILKSILINSVIPIIILRYVLKKMKDNRYGRILNASSIGVKFGGGEKTYSYSYSKHLMEFIPSGIRKLAKDNILINNLRIGVVNTKLHKRIKRTKKDIVKRVSLIPIKRIAEKSEIAEYIYFLISYKNTYTTNQTITIAGGE